MSSFRRICVFCGSKLGRQAAYRDAARSIGQLIAKRRIGIVYGGGRVGMMGELADAALQEGGEVIGILPRHLESQEVAHRGLTELQIVATMHERKAMMADLS